MNTDNGSILLSDARLPGRIITMQADIGETLADLCKQTAYDLSRLKGVGDNVIDATRDILSFYGMALSGDTAADYEGDEHPVVASYRTRLDENYPGMSQKLGTLSDREVGEEFGVSAQSVNNHRRMLGIEKAVRAKKVSPYIARIAALEFAINEAIALLNTNPLSLNSNLEGLSDLLTAALKTKAPAEEASEEAEEEEEVEAPGEQDDNSEEAESAPATDEANNVFEFGESDHSTSESKDEVEEVQAPTGTLTFS